jgi:hypothetical protein
MFSAVLLLILGQVAVDSPEKVKDADELKQRYESFRRAAEDYDMKFDGDRKESFKLIREPVLRWGNQARDNDDGAVFVWTHAGRPQAVAAIFVIGPRTMHELCSLSESPITTTWRKGGAAWRPRKAGVEYRPVAGAPVPAESARLRLMQMRTMADDFTASTTAPPDYAGGRSHGELRLLPRPLYRYEGETDRALDGALFTWAFGTDPEVLFVLEARKTGDRVVWHYAAAPFTDFAILLKHKGELVWSVPLAAESRVPMADRPHAGIWQEDLESGLRVKP